jgi:hypothetical protein
MPTSGLFNENLFNEVLFNDGPIESSVFVVDARFNGHMFDEVLFNEGPKTGIPTVKPVYGIEVIR